MNVKIFGLSMVATVMWGAHAAQALLIENVTQGTRIFDSGGFEGEIPGANPSSPLVGAYQNNPFGIVRNNAGTPSPGAFEGTQYNELGLGAGAETFFGKVPAGETIRIAWAQHINGTPEFRMRLTGGPQGNFERGIFDFQPTTGGVKGWSTLTAYPTFTGSEPVLGNQWQTVVIEHEVGTNDATVTLDGVSELFPGVVATTSSLERIRWDNIHSAYVDSLPPPPIAVGNRKQLFIDGRFVQSASGASIVVNKPQPTAEKLIVQEHPWEDFNLGAYTSVIQDKETGRIRLWYQSSGDIQTQVTGVAYAYSDDNGATWTKPLNLGQVNYDGSTDNNLVMWPAHATTVFENRPDAPPSEKYVMFVGQPNSAFTSPDGIQWSPTGSVPFLNMGTLNADLDSQNVMFWDTRLEEYVVMPRLNLPRVPPYPVGKRAVGRSESSTLEGFSVSDPPVTVFQADAGDAVNLDFYTSATIEYPYAEDAYFMFPAAYYLTDIQTNDGPINIQFAASRDGRQWERYDRDDHIIAGFDMNGNPTNDWESGTMYAGYGLTRDGDELSLYYTAYDVTHGEWVQAGYLGGTMTRAKYRLDGFTSMDADASGGQFTTPPLLFSGNQLRLNVDVAAGGSLQVELRDESDMPIPGFAISDADTITGDSVAMNVTWNGSADLSSLIGQEVKLHFDMADVKLYAFQFVLLLVGDANKDGLVTGADLISVQQNFGQVGPTPLQGDANDDAQVTGADLISVQRNLGKTLSTAADPVPEPATLVLLGFGGLLTLRGRR